LKVQKFIIHLNMQLQEAQEKFIQAWGTLGSNWGINRTMAQIHALLLISPDALSTEDVMEQLNISRGNANMNIRTLIDWGLLYKEFKSGERREFFSAEKDMWKVFKQIAKERRKRELEPIFKVLEDVSKVEGDPSDEQYKAFSQSIGGIQKFAGQADDFLAKVIKADESWFFGILLKMLK
jgi:DNA-binding transcriptional regulator GbsR (MarR family)